MSLRLREGGIAQSSPACAPRSRAPKPWPAVGRGGGGSAVWGWVVGGLKPSLEVAPLVRGAWTKVRYAASSVWPDRARTHSAPDADQRRGRARGGDTDVRVWLTDGLCSRLRGGPDDVLHRGRVADSLAQGRNSGRAPSPPACPEAPHPRLFLLPTRTPGRTPPAAEPFPGAAAQAAADPALSRPSQLLTVTVGFRSDKFHLVGCDFCELKIKFYFNCSCNLAGFCRQTFCSCPEAHGFAGLCVLCCGQLAAGSPRPMLGCQEYGYVPQTCCLLGWFRLSSVP